MSTRIDIATKVLFNGKPHTLFLIENPTIEDVVAIEARLAAADIERGSSDPDRRVGRDIRDILVRIGVVR